MTKICLINCDNKEIVDCAISESSPDHESQLDSGCSVILCENGLCRDDIVDIVCTGYGRRSFSKATAHRTEISCHTRGVHHLRSDIRTIIDIGGQDTKIISISERGKVLDFVMNDKCAAGTGRFLEKVAGFFNVGVGELDGLACQSTHDIVISSTCAIFAESEMIGLIASGESRENIVRAVFRSIAERVLGMSGSISLVSPIAFVGGVAKCKSMVEALSESLGVEVFVPEMADFTGAIGAGLINYEL